MDSKLIRIPTATVRGGVPESVKELAYDKAEYDAAGVEVSRQTLRRKAHYCWFVHTGLEDKVVSQADGEAFQKALEIREGTDPGPIVGSYAKIRVHPTKRREYLGKEGGWVTVTDPPMSLAYGPVNLRQTQLAAMVAAEILI